jgi:hypothetical protein
MLLYTRLRNAEDHVRCRTSAIPYGYWRMGNEEESRMEDRKAYQQSPGCTTIIRIALPRGKAHILCTCA